MKSKYHVPKKFFNDNPLDEISAAKIAYFKMTAGLTEKVDNFILKQVQSNIEPEQLERIYQEQEQISQIHSAEEIVRMMRGNCDIINQTLLCRKVEEMQEEVMPLVVRRFITSMQATFIETAILTFHLADEKYLMQVMNQYAEIRNPYAQSMICISLCEHTDEEANAFLMDEYHRLSAEYPDEFYAEGPLLALYVINGKEW